MNCTKIAIFICFQLCSYFVKGQTDKIHFVENNLTEVKDLIFVDSTISKYNIMERMKFYNVPSVSIAVISNGKIEWAKAYGYADIDKKRLADPNTRYQVASISKSVNGLAMMKLVKSGKLSLSQDIRGYLKTWKFPDNTLSEGKLITLKNLLSHTAGLSVHGFIGYAKTEKIPTINQILNGEKPANNEPVKPIFVPNTQFEYSGGGSVVIRKILDDNISSNYEKLMNNLIIKPLHMKNSTFAQPLPPKITNYAFAYNKDTKLLDGTYYCYPEQTAGGLWSTPTDIATFILAIQSAIKGEANAILDPKTTLEMLTPLMNNYALGFGILEKGGEKYFWHEGESFGYRSIYYGSFTTGKGVVILTNAYPDHAKGLIAELVNVVATTYDWKDFYSPIKKKLAYLAENKMNMYIGEYYSENPAIKISITKNNGNLELTARRTEKLYHIGENTFFVSSSPNDECKFSSSENNGIMDIFEVIQNGNIIIKAKKKS